MRKFKKVRPQDFNVELLLAAAREGRLYVDETRCEVSKDDVIKEVRAYVQRIDVYVTKEFRSSIGDLWNEILSCDEFIELLTPSRKAKKCQVFNKYYVMRIIGVLREKDVYEPFSDSKYIALLEQTDKDCSYRCYLGKGLDQRSLLMKLRVIVAHYQL